LWPAEDLFGRCIPHRDYPIKTRDNDRVAQCREGVDDLHDAPSHRRRSAHVRAVRATG
jgi:hypothetical protein